MGSGDHEVPTAADGRVEQGPGSQETLGVLAFIAAGDRDDVAANVAGQHTIRPGVAAYRWRHELGFDAGSDAADSLERVVEFLGRGDR